MAEPNENQVVRGTPWQEPTVISPAAQKTGESLARSLARPVDLKGNPPPNTAPVAPPKIGGASNMSAVPAIKPDAPIGDSAVGATDIPSVTAPATTSVTPPGTPIIPPATPVTTPPVAPAGSLAASANYPPTDTLSNLGNATDARDLATRSEKALGIGMASDYASRTGGTRLTNAAPGQESNQSIVADQSKQVGTAQFSTGQPFEPSMGPSAGVNTTGGSSVPIYETNYRDKDGNAIATVTGQNQRVGGGTLSVVGGRTAEEDAAIKQRVDSINQQTDMLRKFNIESGRSYAPSSGNEAPASSAGSLWDRPGDRYGDAQMREAQYNSLVNEAANEKGFGSRRRGERKLMAAQAMLAPGQVALENQQKDAASRASLAGSKYATDAGLIGKKMDYEASLYGSQLTAAQQAEKNRLEAAQKNEELGNQREDVITRRAAVGKESGADRLAQAKIQLSGQYAQAKTPAEQQAIIQQAAILGVRPDEMMVGVSTAPK